MALEFAKEHTDKLEPMKNNVAAADKYFADNNSRFESSKEFVFKTAVSEDDRGIADETQRPIVEVNVLEAYISHLLGEFSKQVPSPSIEPADGDTSMAQQCKVIEGHARFIFEESKPIQISTLKNTLSAGFSVLRVKTDYINDHDFRQEILISPVYDVTRTGFDPMARASHKGDGKFCYEMIPKTKEELKAEFPDADIDQINFAANNTGEYRWYYTEGNGKERKDIALICDYYEKKMSYKMLYLITDPTHPDNQITVTKKEYDKLMEDFMLTGQLIAPPKIIKKSRRAQIKIINYKFIGSQILSYEETDYKFLPLVFIDGNSAFLKGKQFTRPYIYHAMDMQRIKNISAQSIMNDVENTRQTDVFLAKEALPEEEEYNQAWLNPQKVHAALFYNAFSESNGNAPLPAPEVISRGQISPALIQLFQISDETIQSVLGSYNAQQGVQSDLSGKAIVKGAIQSNNAALPYITSYVEGMNQVLKIIIDLMPKYYTTLRTIPIITDEGKREYVKINDSLKNPVYKMEYDINDLHVECTMEANFEVQKAEALDHIDRFMKTSPILNEFFSTEGVHIILENTSMKDITQVKEEFGQFWQKKQQQMQQAAQAQQQQNPMILEAKRLEVETQIKIMEMKNEEKIKQMQFMAEQMKQQSEQQIEQMKMAEVQLENRIKLIESMNKLQMSQASAQAENERSELQAAIDIDKHELEREDQQMRHVFEAVKLKQAGDKIGKENEKGRKAKVQPKTNG